MFIEFDCIIRILNIQNNIDLLWNYIYIYILDSHQFLLPLWVPMGHGPHGRMGTGGGRVVGRSGERAVSSGQSSGVQASCADDTGH